MEVARSAPGPCSTRGSGAPGSLSLLVQPPAGRAIRLTYSLDNGWRVDTAVTESPQVADAAYSAASRPGASDKTDIERPMTVFIDGPSGYTYFWIPDKGWKFVGQLTGRAE
jgi:hypothetical protein